MVKTQGKRTDPLYQAQDILSRRDHTEAEVRQKLRRKGFTEQQTGFAIAWLHHHKLLNDKLFAERYVASTLRAKAVGRRYLAHKLKEKGVPASLITAVLEENMSADDEHTLAARAAAAWRRQHPQKRDDQPRLQRFLASRGFSFDAIAAATASADA